jgi:hypothetical protein
MRAAGASWRLASSGRLFRAVQLGWALVAVERTCDASIRTVRKPQTKFEQEKRSAESESARESCRSKTIGTDRENETSRELPARGPVSIFISHFPVL